MEPLSRHIAVTIRLVKPGTRPPVYLAGSFSNPAWLAQEMEYAIDGDGEYEYVKSILAEAGKEYQYKFRLGQGNWWILNEAAPTAIDDVGNRNNLLSVPIRRQNPAPSPRMQNIEAFNDPVEGRIVDGSDLEAGAGQGTVVEIADVAVILDTQSVMELELSPPPLDFGDEHDADSDLEIPWEDRVPLFPHECPGPTDKIVGSPQEYIRSMSSLKYIEDELDFDDPELVPFPTNREGIIAQIRDLERRLPTNEAAATRSPPSPSKFGQRLSALELPSPSLKPRSRDQSPSLDSIAEEQEGDDALPTSISSRPGLPCATEKGNSLSYGHYENIKGDSATSWGRDINNPVLDSQLDKILLVQQAPTAKASSKLLVSNDPYCGTNVKVPGAIGKVQETKPDTDDSGDQLRALSDKLHLGRNGEHMGEPVTADEVATASIQPVIAGLSSIAAFNDSSSAPIDTAKSTSIALENGRSDLKRRKQQSQTPTLAERPLTPSSIQSMNNDSKQRSFLKAFWRVVFVDWIGGFISRLCGGRRHTLLLVVSALLVLAVTPAVYSSSRASRA